MKDIEVKMWKRKSTNSVLWIDGILNNINIVWHRKIMKMVIILMKCTVKKEKVILTQVRSA